MDRQMDRVNMVDRISPFGYEWIMTESEREIVRRLVETDALDTLKIVSKGMDDHAEGQRREPHKTAWTESAIKVHELHATTPSAWR